jgi:hypothetical protein
LRLYEENALLGSASDRNNIALPVSSEQPSDAGRDQPADDEKPNIPGEPVSLRVHVMHSQDLVIDKPFNEVECSSSNKNPSGVDLGAREPPIFGCPEQQHEGGNRQQPAQQVEESVRQHVKFHALHSVSGDPAGKHVMPLQNGVQCYAVEKAGESNSKEES